MTTPTEWSIRSWKERHRNGYFPNSKEHAGYPVYSEVPNYLLSAVRSDSVVLEVGCGYGEWIIPLSRRVRAVFGVDIHPGPLEVARTLFDSHAVINARVLESNGQTLPFADSVFDVVYSISVMQHLPRTIVRGYLHESRRVLRNNGHAIHHFRNADNVGPYPPLATDIEVNHTGDFSVGWTVQEVRDAAKEAGLFINAVHDAGLFLYLDAMK